MMWRSNSVRRARPALGTIVDIRATGAPARILDAGIAAAFAAIEQVQRLMSFHEAGSDLSRLNRHAAREPVAVHPWTWQVLAAAKLLWEHTGGLFDCAVAPVLVAAGYLPMRDENPAASACAHMGDVQLHTAHAVRFGRPLLLDLGGIAKGFAVDRAVEAMRASGIPQGAVNAGGDLRLFGEQPEPIHVRNPENPGQLLSLGDFADTAVATSAAYFAGREAGGRQVTPIVHPGDGQLAGGRRSVTVVAAECVFADALTKPVFLSGSAAPDFLRRFSAQALILK
jgi:thiamine biosynthesis lipoprotein